MPLAHIHLLHLSPTLPLPTAVTILATTTPPPLTLSRVIRWIILPSAPTPATKSLLTHPWDLLYITLSPTLPSHLTPHLLGHYHLTTGIPSRLTTNFPTSNASLLHPSSGTTPSLTGSLRNPRLGASAQTLELDQQLLHWATDIFAVRSGATGKGAVSMLNLLAFQPGEESKAAYQRYGKAFAEDVGKRRGGVAKLVGNVVPVADAKGPGKGSAGEVKRDDGRDGWDEFALAHYPSIEHFVDMLASEDYQEVNLRERVGSLRDTCILCTSEIAVEEILGGEKERGRGASRL
jgi:hypothetical protein